jgi:outer membrane protease
MDVTLHENWEDPRLPGIVPQALVLGPRGRLMQTLSALGNTALREIRTMMISTARQFLLVFFLVHSCAGLLGAQDEVVAETPSSWVKGRGEIDVMAGAEFWRGDSTYRIGGGIVFPDGSAGETWFPISELEFPLDVLVGTVELTWRPGGVLQLGVAVKHNISSDAGTMKDSDWLKAPGSLDIYSESDADLDMWVAEINARYLLYRKGAISLTAGLGYIYEFFDYEISNVDQTYPSTAPWHHEYHADLALLYEVAFHIPYVELAGQMQMGQRFSVEGSVAFSPLVSVEDEDNHLLRDKISGSDADGEAILASLLGSYEISESWFATVGLDYRLIETDGEQTQYESGASLGTIDNTIESEQFSLNVGVGRIF